MTRLGRTSLLLALSLLICAATAYAEGAWVLWKHSYEVWVDTNKDNHRRDVAWKKVKATTAKSDCDDRRVREGDGGVMANRSSPGPGGTRLESRVPERAKLIGSRAADCIRASGRGCRANRPDT